MMGVFSNFPSPISASKNNPSKICSEGSPKHTGQFLRQLGWGHNERVTVGKVILCSDMG